jgi:tetratricopeptide (TPR) repeat protein
MSELDAVRAAANDKCLAVFAGSGLSVLPPAFLPDWRSFNEAVLDAVKTAAAETLADDPDARAALDTLTLARIPVEAFSDQIVDGFSGADYFSVLDLLDGRASNANHQALAELAGRGSLRAIVTTNFDTLIERAFRERGVALQVFAQPRDFEQPPAFEHCVLYKIHGTVGAETTFVDTVSQKMRGLGPAKRTHLHAVYDTFHTLVVGFSGADLAFGQDYLAFDALQGRSATKTALTWVVRAGEKTRPEVTALLERVNAAPLVGSIPEIFASLGVPVETAAKDDEALRATIGKRVRAGVAARLASGQDAAPRALLFCAGILGSLEQIGPASRLLARLDRFDSTIPSELTLMSLVLRATFAMRSRDYPGAAAAVKAAKARRNEPDIEAMAAADPVLDRAFARADSGIANLAGLLAEMSGDTKLARDWINVAVGAARHAESPELAAMLTTNLAQAIRREGDMDAALELARQSSALAWEAAFPRAVCMAALQESSLFLALAEYDAAQNALDAARPRLSWLTDVRARAQLEVTSAVLVYRRGRFAEAWQRWRAVLESLDGNPALRADLTLMLVPLVSRVPELSGQLRDAIDEARAELSPSDKNSGSLAQKLDAMKAALEAGRLEPGPPEIAARDAEDLAIRQALVAAEFEGDAATAAGCLSTLMKRALAEERHARAVDLATGALARAQASGDVALIARALVFIGIATARSGDHRRALEWLSRAEDARGALTPDGRLQLDGIRAQEFVSTGDVNAGLALAETAIAAHAADGSDVAAAMLVLDVGALLVALQAEDAGKWLVAHQPITQHAGAKAELQRQALLARTIFG